jgi:sugar phosphate isomerase/epimerase
MQSLGVQMLNRREFVGASALLVSGIIPRVAPGMERARTDFGNFTVGAQSYCFRNFNFEQAVKRTHDLGLRFMEIYPGHVPVASTAEQIRAVRKLCADQDVTPIAYGVHGFHTDHAANQKVFEFARALGVKFLSADPTPDSFDSLDKLVEEHKIGIAIHPHGPSGGKLHRWYSAEVIAAAVKNHHPLIGACLDTGHLIRADQLGKKLDPAKQIRVMADRNHGIHLKDHDNRTKTDVVYGKGALNVVAVIQALRDVRFQGYISVEYEANPDDPSRDMTACLAVLKAAIKSVS